MPSLRKLVCLFGVHVDGHARNLSLNAFGQTLSGPHIPVVSVISTRNCWPLLVENDVASGPDWWEQKVPDAIKVDAKKAQRKEITSAVTVRSTDPLFYVTFGELGEIIKTNWDIFEDTLTDVRAVGQVLSRLNTLRAPIAHCCALAEDEVVRLRLSLKDWFRLME